MLSILLSIARSDTEAVPVGGIPGALVDVGAVLGLESAAPACSERSNSARTVCDVCVVLQLRLHNLHVAYWGVGGELQMTKVMVGQTRGSIFTQAQPAYRWHT